MLLICQFLYLGGQGTAGLGGVGGPYRLDAGHDVTQVSDQDKANVPLEVSRAGHVDIGGHIVLMQDMM